MSCTVVIPNRNRDLGIVRKTLKSLVPQISDEITVVVIDYGSSIDYQKDITALVEGMIGIELIICPTQEQLWHKTRAINIVLKECQTYYFIVLDMDCITHPDFIQKAMTLASDGACINFPYGFLTEEESKKETPFDLFVVDFVGDLTGTIIARTEDLKDIRGYDEFYHNWGAEDSDILVRMENNEGNVQFYTEEVLLLHQWHPKIYRSKKSTHPYHNHLEQINQSYYNLVKKLGRKQSNARMDWGIPCIQKEYDYLSNPTNRLAIYNKESDVKAFLAMLESLKINTSLEVTILESKKEKLKAHVKKILKKKVTTLMDLELLNEKLLELIISRYRNCPYEYRYLREEQKINFKIYIK